MYVPSPYQETRRGVLLAAIEARSFGSLISAGAGEVRLSHLPFALNGEAGAARGLAGEERNRALAVSIGLDG